ncbi:hypothetical protein RI367_008712, partial [Sorochytrium milnesiophthora]
MKQTSRKAAATVQLPSSRVPDHCDFEAATPSRVKEHSRQIHQPQATVLRGGVPEAAMTGRAVAEERVFDLDSGESGDDHDVSDLLLLFDTQSSAVPGMPVSYCVDLDLLLCGQCGNGFRLEHASAHLKACGLPGVESDQLATALAAIPYLVTPTWDEVVKNRAALYRPLSEAVDPIPMLSCYDGLACPMDGCPYAGTSSYTMAQHLNSRHGESSLIKGLPCRVQRLYTQGEERGFFCVAGNVSVDCRALTALDRARQQVFDSVRIDQAVSPGDTGSTHSKFVDDLNWLKYLSDVPLAQLWELAKLERCAWTLAVRDSVRRVLAGLYPLLEDDQLRRKAFNSGGKDG